MDKTPLDIINLKRNWINAPSWDIEDTPGYEVYHDELLTWRQERAARLSNERAQRITDRAAALNCSIELVAFIETLERRIQVLESKLNE